MTDYAIESLRVAREPARPSAPTVRTRTHRLEVPFDVHRAILAGRAPGLLDRGKPEWAPGDAVRVSTATTPDDRRSEDPVTLTVTALSPVMVGDLQAEHARLVGLRLATDVQRLALELPADTPAAVVNMRARGNQSTVWLTSWARVEADEVRIVRDAGWQAPSGPLQWRPIDAGEAVPADYQRELCSNVADDNAAAQDRRREQSRERGRKVKATSKAKRAVAHREATRRRRIDVARTANSSVVEAHEEPSPDCAWYDGCRCAEAAA